MRKDTIYFKAIYLLFFFIIVNCQDSFSQTLSSNFTTEVVYCSNENISFVNGSINASEFEWDFCEGDFFNDIQGIDLGVVTGLSQMQDIDLIRTSGLWYGFLVSRANSKIIRVDFGSSLENPPTYTDLGNIGGLLDFPGGLRVVEESGNFYALVVNSSASANLIRLNFGNDITSIPTATDLTNFGGLLSLNFGIDFQIDGNDRVLIVTNGSTRKINAINFGNSVTNTPMADDVTVSTLIEGGFLEIFQV